MGSSRLLPDRCGYRVEVCTRILAVVDRTHKAGHAKTESLKETSESASRWLKQAEDANRGACTCVL